ncbi:AIPR family protein [Marinobacter sp.]|uniref:AIPR family protein n=1 Tax=Marinobacter sp. TaxID=50741 RepID=UPI003A8D049F
MSLQLRQIENYLEENFFPNIDISDLDLKKESEPDLKNKKTTRSLAAISVNMMSESTIKDACVSVTDGFKDNGLDAIYYAEQEKCLYVIQSKYNTDGNGSIDTGDTRKFIGGVKKLIKPDFSSFNEKIQKRKEEITQNLLDPQNRFHLIIVHSGKDKISKDCEEIVNEFLDSNNEIADQFHFTEINLKDIHKYVSSGALAKPIDHEAAIHNWSFIKGPLRSVYGQIAGSDLASWYDSSGPHLFAPNIRVYLGNTEVNEGITETVNESPDMFWYYNNGITALCSKVTKKPLGGDSREVGYFNCDNIRIVNGAQTVGTLYSLKSRKNENLEKTRVWIRIIEIDPESFNENEEDSVSKKITQSTNTQNKIEKRDFVSLDPEQKRIHDELALNKINYVYKAGETSGDNTSSFDLPQATIARACSQNDIYYAVQAKREISKLWDDIQKPPYKLLFNGGVKSMDILKEVEVLKSVDTFISQYRSELSARDELLITHGNRFLLHCVMQYLHEEIKKEVPNKEVINEACELFFVELGEVIEDLHPSSYLGSLFKNTSKCREIKTEILKRMKMDSEFKPLKTAED